LSTDPNFRERNAPVSSSIETEPGRERRANFYSQSAQSALPTDSWFVTCRNILGFVWWCSARTDDPSVRADSLCTNPVSNSHCCRLYQLQPCGLLFWAQNATNTNHDVPGQAISQIW